MDKGRCGPESFFNKKEEKNIKREERDSKLIKVGLSWLWYKPQMDFTKLTKLIIILWIVKLNPTITEYVADYRFAEPSNIGYS